MFGVLVIGISDSGGNVFGVFPGLSLEHDLTSVFPNTPRDVDAKKDPILLCDWPILWWG